jgi:hypothetical protein
MNPDELVEYIRELRGVVQAEFDSLTPDGDNASYDARRADLDAANQVAQDRGIDVPPGR